MQKRISRFVTITLSICMIITCVNFVPMSALAATFAEDTLIELETTKPKSNFTIESDKAASGGKYIEDTVSGSAKLADPDSTPAEIAIEFNASKDATYYVWMKYSCANDSKDSFFVGFNDEKVTTQYGTAATVTGEGIWAWKMVKSAALKIGKNTLKMWHREAGLKMDCVYITSDAAYKPDATSTAPTTSTSPTTTAPAVSPKPITPIGTVYQLTNGSFMVEAESTASKGAIEILDNSTASGKKSLSFLKVPRVDNPSAFGDPAASYAFNVDKEANFSAWIRVMVKNNGSDTLWACYDNNAYAQATLPINESDWGWMKVVIGKLSAGTHTFNLTPRETGMEIDKIIITNKASYIPTGEGELPGKNTVYQTVYPTPSILPPSGHPRVYFTAKDLPKLLENTTKPQNASAWAKHQANLLDTTDGTLAAPKGKTNYNASILGIIESRAFDYILRKNTDAGKNAIAAIRNYCDTVVFDPDDYNGTGQTVFTIAAVYDWCYPLLSEDDKTDFPEYVTAIASQMEIKWPPTQQGAVTGHGVEGQLMRDLMCAGIAMYDERPDIYINCAGRFFKEYIDPKKFMYAAKMHNQGNHYMAYRFQWEILTAMLWDRIGVPQVFGPDQQYTLYWALYTRRPDGQVFRDGDTSKNNATLGTYDSNFYRSMIHAGNYFNDPYLKREGERELPFLKAVSPTGNQSLNCVEFLIFNNPDLEGRPVSELPLSMYNPSPKGAMLARTGWEDGIDSPAVVAEMKINEWWFANHQHLDAGSFQLYYKGALATDSGYYQAATNKVGSKDNDGSTGYGGQHDANYNKRTIAHNTMLIYDPNESMSHVGGTANDGGQRSPNNAAEAKTYEMLKDPANGYEIGKILGNEIANENPLAPNYTYLKGDLTKAYSNKISDFERSFMFLNLKDKDHPAAMVVFDRVVSSNADFKKTWLMHGLEEPAINGNQTVFKDTRSGYNGKLTIDTLLPAPGNAVIEKVGGPDKEFWVNGINYFVTTVKGGNNEGGGWRMELSPKTKNNTDYFLNVLQVGDVNPDMPPLPVTSIETSTHVGVVVADRVVVMGKDKNRTKANVAFDFANEGTFEVTVADLEAGTWKVTKDGTETANAIVTKDGGVAVFSGESGSYTLSYANANSTRPAVKVETPTHEGIGIRVNNRLIYTDVPPTIQNDRTLVPMRAIFEKLGVTVTWNPDTLTATAVDNSGREVKITQDSTTAYINGEPQTLDVPAQIINDRFLVPVRFVSEAYFAKVEWDPFAKIVNIMPGTITTGGASANKEGYVTIKSSEWSDSFEGGTGPMTYDDNTETLWSVDGVDGQWLKYDFGSSVPVKGMSVMWNKGDIRQAYFTLDISDDGSTWKTIIPDGKGSGLAALTFEDYLFPAGTTARYVKFNFKGNSESSWNAIIEIKFMKP